MEDVPSPFTQSRLRSFTGRLESSLDARMSVANAMALAPGVLFAPMEKLDCARSSNTAKQGCQPLSSTTQQQSSTGTVEPGSGQLPESALSEINALKSEIAGIEALLGHLKKVLPSVQKGRGIDNTHTEEQLRSRAQSHHRRIKELQGGQDATSTGISNAAAWSSTLRAGDKPSTKPEKWGLDRGGTPVTVTPVGRGEAIMLEAALDEALPEGALTAKYAAPALSAKAAAARAAGPALQADIARAAVQLGGASRAPTTSVAAATLATTTTALRDSSAVQGGTAIGGSGNSFTGSSAKQSAAQLLLSSQNMEDDIEMLSMTAKEAARQVAAHCAERARVILKIDVRYQEAFRAFRAILEAVHAANAALVARLDQAHGQAQDLASVVASLEEKAESQTQHLEAKDTKLAELQSTHEALQWDTQQKIASLSSQNTILADEVEHFSRRLEEAEASFHDLLEERMASATSQVAGLTDERDDLHQRLRFLEKQNALLRHENSRVPCISHTAMQTDPVEWAAAADDEEEEEDAGLGQQVHVGGLDWLPTDAALGPKHQNRGMTSRTSFKQRRKKPKHLGGFLGMLTVDKPGRVRGPMWTTNTIAQIYQDKTIHDAVCDRESSPRSTICSYVHEWHLHKYGLRSLADASLMDLIASARHHQRTSARIGWFAHFTGLDEASDPMDSLQHLSFYLFVLQQLMWPSSLQMAFPETSSHDAAAAVAGAPSDVPVMIKGQQAIDATKAIFRYLNDPDAAIAFIAKHIEPAPIIPSLLPPEASWGGGGVDAGAVDSRAGGPNSYLVPLDPLVKALMTEFHKRIDKNIAHLNALFKAGDLDRDGNINYDDFVTLIRLAAPDATERLLTKAYTEAVRHQPAACYLVSCSTFVEVARNFGFDRWKVDASGFASALPGMGPAGGAALLAEGGVPALLSARKGLNRPTSSGSQVSNQQPLSPPGSADGRVGSSPDKQVTSAGGLLRGIERFDTERGIKACLEACLVGMRPSLEELMADARARLGSPAHPTLQHLECQWEHFQSALAKVRGQPDPLGQPTPSLTVRINSSTQPPNSAPDPQAGNSTLASQRPTTHARGRGPVLPSSHAYPPANAAHAWLCFQLLYESLVAALSSRTLVSRAGSVKRANSSGSGFRSPLSHSPRSGSPSSAAGQQRRMLVVPALPWRAGPASPMSPSTTSGLLPFSNASHKLRSIPSLSRPQLSPLGLESLRSPASPTRLQATQPQEQQLVQDADPLLPETPSHQQHQQLAQEQWDSAQAARMEAMQKQQQEQQQLQEMARALRASAMEQQLRAVPPQVLHLDPDRHRQQQQQQHSPPAKTPGEFEFAPVLKK
uniref:EF-hand domain-containing protein n=1 Tax=Dunaliella tertiolecta TaxID=3047 RepID=A0A7S3VKW2_DUNTE|mmetsp:Transcript_11708/g.31930  ORF Transcript_11708/g.31930 Transcript_11708/m.31930 type:complete len:1332 (-) Transcript_11708:432-4427(-)